MSFKERLRTIFACLVLEAGVLMGTPIRVEQVQELLHSLNQPKVAETTPQQDDQEGDD